MLSGSRRYWTWLALLALVLANGIAAYTHQLQQGLVVTGMSDQVSWGFYIANFSADISGEEHFFSHVSPGYSRMYFAVAMKPGLK